MSGQHLTFEIVEGLDDVDPDAWDTLCGADDPFIEHGFLSALETSGSVGERAGWIPRHVLVRDGGGRLRGAMPLYLKDNSFGEYIFDWGWADASMSHGIPYYPKLVSAVPFTPVTGRRLLVDPRADEREVIHLLFEGATSVAEAEPAWSLHVLFLTEAEQDALVAHGMLRRLTFQFHWENRGYRDFAHYLSHFRNSARKSVRRERSRAASAGLILETLFGDQLSDEQWEAIYRFYRDTTGRKWGRAYLNRAFFEIIRETFAHRVVVTLASTPDRRPVAGALSFHKGSHLYGRYWGCLEEHDALHFELCYYRPIELCIERGWRRFEAGAQGIHKLRRGLMPSPTYSAHHLRHAGLDEAIADYCRREARETKREIRALADHGPFKRG